VKVIQENLRAAQSRQKSYFNKRRKPLQFEVGDQVYFQVSPTKGVQRFGVKEKPLQFEVGDQVYFQVLPTNGVQRFGVKGKLAPRYIGLYEIIEVCGPIAY